MTKETDALSTPDNVQWSNYRTAMTVLLVALVVGRGGALVESMTFNRRVVGSTPALTAT